MVAAAHGWTVGLVGYGEVGRIFAEDLRRRGVRVCAYDVKLEDDVGAGMRGHAADHGVEVCESHATLARRSELVVSAVTAAGTVQAAGAVAQGLRAGTYFLDVNSVSPDAKRAAAARVEAAGGAYVEAAVMASVPPYRVAVPMLLGGPSASSLQPALAALGFDARVYSEVLGVASATKLCRSVVVKGLEALVIEAYAAARTYGVEDAVLASLRETFPGVDWEAQGDHFFRRVIVHGRRRSEEMQEAAATVRQAGLAPRMAEAIAATHAAVADLSDIGAFAPPDDRAAREIDWRTAAGTIAAAAPTPWNVPQSPLDMEP